MLNAIFKYDYLQYVLLASVLASVICGIVGVIVVEKKLVMMSGGIAHTAYGGVGLGYLIGIEPIYGAFAFSVASALGIGYMKRKGIIRSDVIIGLLWSFGMACGIFFIRMKKGYAPDLGSYLFGNILTVLKEDIWLMVILTIITVLTVTVFFAHWKTYLFDEEFAGVTGVNTVFLEYLLLVLISMTVVVLIRAVGIILVIALLTAPAATAAVFTTKLKNRMLYSVLLGLMFCLTGLWISYEYDIASGATIVFVSVITYFFTQIINNVINKRKKRATS